MADTNTTGSSVDKPIENLEVNGTKYVIMPKKDNNGNVIVDTYATKTELSNEINARKTAVSSEETARTTETSERKSADSTLQKNIDTETSERKSADTTLQANIDAEAAARQKADENLSNELGKKANTADVANTYLPAVVGAVVAFAGSTTPQGWLLCDGSAVSRTDYAALYAVIGTTYGAGDGSTTFNLPNLVDKFVEGSATAGTVKSAGLPNITGRLCSKNDINNVTNKDQFLADKLSEVSGVFSVEGWGTKYSMDQPSKVTGYGYDALNFNASKSNPIYGKSDTVQPPALTMRYIIKY